MKAYERLWVIGDKFVEDTFGQYVQNAYGDDGKVSYMRAHYDVTGFCPGNEFLNGNILGRLRNAMATAINKQSLMPRAVIFVIENDILEAINHYKPGISHLLGKSIEWLMNQIHRMVVTHKEILPSKSRKFKYPAILWCLLPQHEQWSEMGEYRAKFNFCLKNTASIFREMGILQLDWDEADPSYFTMGRMNGKGYTYFWLAVDNAFQLWDKEQMRLVKINKPIVQNSKTKEDPKTNAGAAEHNHYREKVALQGKFTWKPSKTRFKLPKPKGF